jgi:predicted transcriptional regulator
MLRTIIMENPAINISELAEQFSLPFSSAALRVRVLEEAGFIFIQEEPGLRGEPRNYTPSFDFRSPADA